MIKRPLKLVLLGMGALFILHGCSKCSEQAPKSESPPEAVEDVVPGGEVPSDEQLSNETGMPGDEQETVPIEDSE